MTVLLVRVAAAAFVVLAPFAHAHGDDVLSSLVAAVAVQMDPRVAPTLARLDGPGRQLLALRSYVRSAAHLDERWSWSQERIEAFEGSPEKRDLQ